MAENKKQTQQIKNMVSEEDERVTIEIIITEERKIGSRFSFIFGYYLS